ncbi:MAG: hypothetical protein JWN77_348 [Frankiales bacterium]|jgi:hypothetical protein|nr:hypothetical protein [Frankiales bacterium]
MPESPYAVSLTELEQSAHVEPEDMVEELDVTPPVDPDTYDGTAHLPGHLRPYSA